MRGAFFHHLAYICILNSAMKKYYFLFVLFIFLDSNAQVINFPDAAFKARLIGVTAANQQARNLDGNYFKIDANNDLQIDQSEALQVKYLNLSNNANIYTSISDLSGIAYFTNIEALNVNSNVINGVLDLTSLVNLESIVCNYNQLTGLLVTNLADLTTINCYSNELESLDLTGLVSLAYLDCEDNHLTSLDASASTQIYEIQCSSNELTSLNLTGLTKLKTLACKYNSLSVLDVSTCIVLNELNCMYVTNLATLDLTYSSNLAHVYCSGCTDLETLRIKGKSTVGFLIEFLPNLSYFCVQENRVALAESLIASYGYNCVISSYCTFVPPGQYFVIEGVSRFDIGNDGCNADDIFVKNCKFSVSDMSTLISDNSGAYRLPVPEGLYTLAPILENPSYFNSSPTSITANFPASSSPFEQNFCFTANGIHPDLEIVLLSTDAARPGFDAHYKILYKNKGNQIQSGTFYISFDGNISDFVSSDVPPSLQSANALSWNFTNLAPFETRAVNVTFNLNSPIETPSVNGGDTLDYTAVITSFQTDDSPSDNSFGLSQNVVNSLDPNDKTCLEGNIISPEMVGNYVHYIIRFENTGTANAQNIVVKDMIDTAKFDVSSLVPLDGSHPYTTRISNTNKVEFIFENIQLPFDDANNDGYVAFKIKTKPTLVVGNTFSNTANIYFDYNAPIITNTATTAIQVLGTDDFDFNNHFTLYPNPATDILNIKSKDNTIINSLSLYNTLGQLLITVTNPMETIDVSELAYGSYVIRINTDRGSSNAQFIKK
jgi:type IX secretion system substrate protein